MEIPRNLSKKLSSALIVGTIALGYLTACSPSEQQIENAAQKAVMAALTALPSPFPTPTPDNRIDALIAQMQPDITIATPIGTPIAIPQSPTPEATAINTPVATTAEIQTSKEQPVNLPFFEITGAREVDHTQLVKWANEEKAAPGDVIHVNTIGLGTEMILAEPGVRTVDDISEEDASAWHISPDTQKLFEQPGPSFFGIMEGGFNMFTAAAMEITYQGVNGPINIKLGAKENHGWVVIVKGLSRDYDTPVDLNDQLKIDKYNPSFTLGTRLPPGQFVSQDYFEQNVATAHQKNCGMDGCFTVSAVFVDPSGAYTVITQNGLNAPWQPVATNIK